MGSWSEVSCGDGGCSGGTPISSGKIIVATSGQQFTDCYNFVSWDRDDQSWGNGAWCYSWAWVGGGYTGNGNCFDVKVVECYDDDDCDSLDFECDKSGEWDTWTCVQKEVCGNGNCVGDETYEICPRDCGECLPEEVKCIGEDYYSCSDFLWLNQGEIIGKCGVEAPPEPEGFDFEKFINEKAFEINGFEVTIWMVVAGLVLFFILIKLLKNRREK